MHESQVDDFNCQLLQGLAKTCPARRTEPKKPGIDAETWALRTQKLIARRGLREIARRRRNELLRFCMKSWKEPSSDLPHLFWQYDGWLLCLNVKILGRFRIRPDVSEPASSSVRISNYNKPLIGYIQKHQRLPFCTSSKRSLAQRICGLSSSKPCP